MVFVCHTLQCEAPVIDMLRGECELCVMGLVRNLMSELVANIAYGVEICSDSVGYKTKKAAKIYF